MNLRNYFLYCFFLFSLGAWSQVKTIHGVVTDASTQMPIPGVNVILKNTNSGGVTDFDGKYEIEVNSQDTLVFSYVGFKTQEIAVGTQNVIDVALTVNAQSLAQVVVVGYGTQNRGDITGAVSVVDGEKFENRPKNSVGNLLEGQTAGVHVLNSSGKPSQGFDIRIRGTSSITSNSNPLYVIDGVPVTDTKTLNPSDIESISILKDAASAAIYGAQGGNGVVLITTKKGKSEKPIVKMDTYTGFSQVWRTLKVLNGEQYRDLMTELGKKTDWQKYNNNIDWQDKIFGNGFSQNYNVSVSGKNNGTTYYLSGGYLQQKGAVLSSQVKRAHIKLNLSQEVNDWLKVGTNLTYTRYADVDVTDNQAVNQGGVLLGTLVTPPNIGVFNEDGTYATNPFQDWENPVASAEAADQMYKQQRLLGNIFAEVNFTKGLEFRSNFGIDYNNGRYDYFLDPYLTSYGRSNKGIGRYNTNLSNFFIFDNTLTYKTSFGKSNLKLLAGTVFQKTRDENSAIERRNFASNVVKVPSAGSELISATADKSEKVNASYISRLNYDFAKKYLLTANFRADGSSNFGPSQRWGYFPSFSAGWRISKENFMNALDFVSDLKLRAGWGIVGNDQIGRYAYFGAVGNGGNYPIGGVVQPGTYPARIKNNDLKWEESEQTNLGLDMAFFENRIKLSVDVYKKNTSDLLLDAPLPTASGFDHAIQNIGEVQNKGLEIQLNTNNFKNKIFQWNTGFNISFNRNKVIRIPGDRIFAGSIAGRDNASLVEEGKPLGTFFGYIWGGVDPKTGNVYYVDQTGSTTFDPSPEDRTVIGDPNPDFIYGFTNNFTYKGFGLNVFIQGSQGNDVLNATKIQTEGMIDTKNQTIAVLHRWQNPGDMTDIPKAIEGSTKNSRISTHFIEDGSYLRFKTVTLSYNLPSPLLEKIKIAAAKVYVTGENLFTITDYSGFDPEVNAFGGSNTAQGIDFGTYPQTRNIIVGMNLTF